MSKLNYLGRAIKNPAYLLNRNFILHPFNSASTIRKILSHNHNLLDSAKLLTNDTMENLQKYYNEITNNNELHTHLNEQYRNFEKDIEKLEIKNLKYSKTNPAGRLNRQSQGQAGFLLYVLVRSLKPEVIVETGVSSGESSTFFLQGLEDNKKGKLYSIDLPPEIDQKQLNIVFPSGKSHGWIIPDYLRNRWELNLGPSQELLEPMLKRLGSIDIFWHDSLHTYEHMMFEFQTSWKFIKNGGILISDDIATLNEKGSSPLINFADSKKINFVIYQLMGGLRKL